MCAVLQPQGAVLARDLTFSFVVQDGSASGKMISTLYLRCSAGS